MLSLKLSYLSYHNILNAKPTNGDLNSQTMDLFGLAGRGNKQKSANTVREMLRYYCIHTATVDKRSQVNSQ